MATFTSAGMKLFTLALPFSPAFTVIPETTSPLLHPSPLLHSWSYISFICRYHHTLLLGPLLSRSPKGWALHFALSSLSPQIRRIPSVSQFLYASSFNPCFHTQSLYVCVFTVSSLSSLTTFILLGPTLGSFLP